MHMQVEAIEIHSYSYIQAVLCMHINGMLDRCTLYDSQNMLIRALNLILTSWDFGMQLNANVGPSWHLSNQRFPLRCHYNNCNNCGLLTSTGQVYCQLVLMHRLFPHRTALEFHHTYRPIQSHSLVEKLALCSIKNQYFMVLSTHGSTNPELKFH